MSFIAQPAANLHSPGAIGDVTPGTLAVTTSTLGGNATFSVDNTYDIGASGANRPRTGYFASSIHTLVVEVEAKVYFTTGDQISSTGSGIIRFVDATEAAFNRLQLGGTSASFPAIKRNNAALDIRLADDSAFAPLRAKLTTDTNATTGLGAGLLAATTNATVTVYDASGQAYRVPCII